MKLYMVGFAPSEDNEHMKPDRNSNCYFSPTLIWADSEEEAVNIGRSRYDGTFFLVKCSVYDVVGHIEKR